jgi:hypothetical protein
MQCVTGSAGWRLGGGSRQPSRPKSTLFIRTVCPLPLPKLKKSSVAGCRASREQRFKTSGQNFGAGKILPKENRYSKGRNYLILP